MTETATETTVPTTAEIRAWAVAQGLQVGKRGTLSAEVRTAYNEAHASE